VGSGPDVYITDYGPTNGWLADLMSPGVSDRALTHRRIWDPLLPYRLSAPGGIMQHGKKTSSLK
jgi:hypothetical protein